MEKEKKNTRTFCNPELLVIKQEPLNLFLKQSITQQQELKITTKFL